MEQQKQISLSALSVGIGIGIGVGISLAALGVASTHLGMTPEQIQVELESLIVDGEDTTITFHNFPYHLTRRTHSLLKCATHIYLDPLEDHYYPAVLPILLSGPSEPYVQCLAQALAHHYKAKLLLLDLSDFSIKTQGKYGISKKAMILNQVSSFLGSLSIRQKREDLTDTSCINSLSCCFHSAPFKHISFDEKFLIQSLYKVLTSVSDTDSIILYVRDVDKLFLSSPKFYKLFYNLVKKLSGPIVILGSQIVDPNREYVGKVEELHLVFPYNIDILKSETERDGNLLAWKTQLEQDIQTVQHLDNVLHIVEVLADNEFICDDLISIPPADILFLRKHLDDILEPAVTYHMKSNPAPQYRHNRLILSLQSLYHGVQKFLETNNAYKTENPSTSKPSESDYEKRIRAEVTPAEEIDVTFSDIGALDEIKKTLMEQVILPLRRPELFNDGSLKPCRGILLFGPPGTGKTMLAKAIAKEAGASIINLAMSTITSTLFGESEKNVRAVFTVAAKVAPTIIFVDEVDSMLGKRTSTGEHEFTRKIKNEFMTLWDGLLTKPSDQILVLGATNRPFDLDEAAIRRFEHRIMVGLPCIKSREKILKTLLAKERVEKDIDFKVIATMTEGYSGSDLKNLCLAAAYRPVREMLQLERQKDMGKKKSIENGTGRNNEEGVIPLRALNMEDMIQAKNQVAASFCVEGSVMGELNRWNELYGNGGSRKKEQLSYFL